ncbi:MAG: dTDP-4-dehydrorhamnose reductase [Solirubrobacteraceae bacterium]
MSKRALITGGGGQLGSDVAELLQARGAAVHAPPRAELDITDNVAVDRVFSEFDPTLVLNCAAFHNVEVCEREEDRAFAVNVRAVGRLARRCDHHGAKFVHLSTNYVFDGTAADPYTERSIPAPRSIYAISKLAGEHAAISYAPDALIVRTAGLYGMHGSASKGGNFVTRMLARARERGSLEVVADQRLTPTFTADLAAGILDAVSARLTGTLHLTNAGETSWHGFTEAIMMLAGLDVPVAPTTTTMLPAGANRPLNGVLGSVDGPEAGLEPLRPWREALADHMERADLLAGNHAHVLTANR